MAGVVLLEDILSISGVQIVYRVDSAILSPGGPGLDDQTFAGRDARPW